MTDTPVNSREAPPVHASERVKAFIGDLARPFAIIATSYAAAHATVVIACKVENGNDGAIFAGAYFLGVASLYGAKAVETINAARARRDVDVANVSAGNPTP
jgi:hypothetical protein